MLYVFSIYDSAAGYYKEPFCCNNKGIALREFADACNNPQTFLGKHPADYTLFLIGTFNDDTGVFEQMNTHLSLGKAIEFIKPNVSRDNIGRDDVN